MGVKAIKRNIRVFSKREVLQEKNKDFINIIGGIPMEQINRKGFASNRLNEKKNILNRFLKSLSENSKKFYKKYLRSTVNYDYLEMDKIKRPTMEAVMFEFIRRQ